MENRKSQVSAGPFSPFHGRGSENWRDAAAAAACSALQVTPGYGDGTGYWNKRQGGS